MNKQRKIWLLSGVLAAALGAFALSAGEHRATASVTAWPSVFGGP